MDVGFGRCASSGTHFAALAVVGVLPTRAELLGNILSINLGGRRIVGDIVVFFLLLIRRESA